MNTMYLVKFDDGSFNVHENYWDLDYLTAEDFHKIKVVNEHQLRALWDTGDVPKLDENIRRTLGIAHNNWDYT